MASSISNRQGKSYLVRLGSGLAATALACAALAAVPASAMAASTTVTITSSTPTVIVTLNKGETANINFTLSTTDPDESGEGELLAISYGGFTTTYPEYGIPDNLPITATTDGETVSAWIQGTDGDESASVTINTNPNPLASAPSPVKQWATKIGIGTGILSGGLWTCAEFAPIFSPPTAALKATSGRRARLTPAALPGPPRSTISDSTTSTSWARLWLRSPPCSRLSSTSCTRPESRTSR